MPGPPGSGVTSPARRNRTRPINWLSPVDVPDVSETGAVMVIAVAKSKALQFKPMNQDVSRRAVFLKDAAPA